MPTCATCNGHVSQRYQRVLARRDGTVHCPNCQTIRQQDALRNIHG